MRTSLVSALVVVACMGSSAYAQDARVDFKRDVQPIFSQHCISCHGPTQQMNGFRLDRRSAAMRGGTFPVIGPGNAEGTRFYLRLIGTQVGTQMPPAAPLSAEEIDTLKRWINEGAVWPDDVSGEGPAIVPHPAATRMMQALRRADRAAFQAALSADAAGARAVGEGGATPLMYAALYGDADAVRRLLAAGADPNVATANGTTALMWAVRDAEKTRLLLDAGANTEARGDDGRTPLMIAATTPGSSGVASLLIARGAKTTVTQANRTTAALRLAAATGDAALMKVLIDGGADLKADGAAAFTAALTARCLSCAELVVDVVAPTTFNGQLINMARRNDVAVVRFLLDRGAELNARNNQGQTPLMAAASSEFYPVDVVRFLIERGADVNAATPAGVTALSLALLRGGPIVDLLVKAGATRPASAAPAQTPAQAQAAADVPRLARAAVQRTLPLLQKSDVTFQRKSGCVSCHNNSLTAVTLDVARRRGFTFDEAVASDQVKKVALYLESWRDSLLRGIGIPGGQDTVSYIGVGLAAASHDSDPSTEAMALYLTARQLPDGRWPVAANRPPIESSDFQVTAMSMRAIQRYAPAAQRTEAAATVARGAQWLASAMPASTEDRALQILGLTWAGRDAASLRAMSAALAAEQGADGGWSQFGKSSTMSSDAYATGEALFALAEAGMAPADPVFVRGVRFLLNTQLPDGSWHVRTRANPVQVYFESDFPHGKDQFVSAAGTNWATIALAIAAGPAARP